MNHLMWTTRTLVSVAFLVTATSAIAGALGATSTGAVSISVTIPPHVKVSEGANPHGDAGKGDRSLCVETSRQVGLYHVVLIGPEENSEHTAVLFRNSAYEVPEGPVLQCGFQEMDAVASLIVDETRQQSLEKPSKPLTLLIVPD